MVLGYIRVYRALSVSVVVSVVAVVHCSVYSPVNHQSVPRVYFPVGGPVGEEVGT